MEPGTRFTMATAQGPFPMETTYTWEDTAAGDTQMTLRNRGEPGGVFRLATPVMVSAMRRANRFTSSFRSRTSLNANVRKRQFELCLSRTN